MGRRRVRASTIALVLGVVVGGACFVRGLAPMLMTAFSPASIHVPGEATLQLSPGTYMVYERTGTQSGGGGVTFTNDHGVTMSPEDVTVTDTHEHRVATFGPGNGSETMTRGSAIYTGAVRFRITEGGRYRVAVTSGSGTALVSRSLADSFGRAWRWLLGAVAGGVVAAVAALVMFIGWLRRRHEPLPVPVLSVARVVPGPAWYPDPTTPQALRYWDGSSWTDHRAPVR